VTTALQILEGNHFEAWRARVGKAEADKVTGNAKVFGTRVHSLAEVLAHDPKAPVPPGMEPYAEAIRAFLRAHVRRVIATEAQIVSYRQGFGGKMDLYCEMTDGSMAVVDWKTTKQLTKSVGHQLAGYALLAREKGWSVNKRVGVRICKDKPGEFRARTYADRDGDVRVFRCAVALWHAVDAQRRDPLCAWTPGELVA
jgi:hypothetical protein